MSTSLYSYDNEERTNIIHTGSAQTLRELATNTPFLGRDRAVLPELHFIFRDVIDTKNSLPLTLSLDLPVRGSLFFTSKDKKRYPLSYLRPYTEERRMKWPLTATQDSPTLANFIKSGFVHDGPPPI